MSFTLKDLEKIPKLDFQYIGKKDFIFDGFANIRSAKINQITFCNKIGSTGLNLVKESKSDLILIDSNLYEVVKDIKKNYLVCNNPRLAFIRILNSLFVVNETPFIHPNAIIDKSAKIGSNCTIGAYVTISKNVIIGDNTILKDKVTVFHDVEIGSNCIINAGTVIGSDGFGYERDGNEIVKFPHFGKVIIGDNVEIGSNTCIDRGSLSNTIIEDEVKIDNLVHVAHNVVVKKRSFLIANCMIGGSAVIGESAWIAPSANLMNGITFGDNSVAGMGSVVLKSVEPNKTVIGVPAKELLKRERK